MWNYHSRAAYSCVLILLSLIALSRQSDKESDVISNSKTKHFDETKFITYSVAIASSPPLLRNLAENEEVIYVLIKDFYTRYAQGNDMHLRPPTEPPFILMHSYLVNFEITTGQLTLKLEKQTGDKNYRPFKAVWNPLTTYSMFQRFTKPLKEIVRSLDTTNEAEFALQRQIFNVMRSTGWPTEEDLKAAMSAILRIQYVYDLPTYQVAFGNLMEFETHVNMTAVDCVEIGKRAMEDSYHALAVEWFETALWKYKYAPGLPTAEISGSTYESALEYYVKLSQETHDHHWNLSEKWDALFFTTTLTDAPSLSRVKRRTTELQAWKGGTSANLVHINYWGTCSGENYKSESEKAKLFCWYETEVSYYYKINPLKAELLSIEPLTVIQYYDMIGDKMIEKIKLDSNHRLAHSTVYSESFNQVVSPIRTSLNTWIDDNTREGFFSVPKKIEAATGLSVRSPTSSEYLQVAAYTAGSHYSVHLDAFASRHEEGIAAANSNGDRIATFIYYLTDIEKGGGTSFPQSGIASQPVKGSAVLWFNLRRDGQVDPNTWHGACPIVVGEKWICNKWIRSDDQMFLPEYQCVPDQDSHFRVRINGKDLMDLIQKD